MSLIKAAMQALDLGNAAAYAGMGLKSKQLFDVFGAYFRGVEFPKTGQMAISGLRNLASRPMVGAARAGLVGFGALAAWNMMPRHTAFAIPAGLAAGTGTGYGLGRFTQQFPRAGMGLRIGGGLLAGSLVYQGLRSPQPSEYQVS